MEKLFFVSETSFSLCKTIELSSCDCFNKAISTIYWPIVFLTLESRTAPNTDWLK